MNKADAAPANGAETPKNGAASATSDSEEAVEQQLQGVEEPVVEPEPKTPEQLRIEELEAELHAANAKLRQYSDAVDRVRREFTESRGRLEREHARTLDDHKSKLVQGLLGVADTLDSALQGAGDGGKGFIDGVTIVRDEFAKALGALGLTRFDPTGEVFDPERHNALTMMPVTDKAHDGTVVQVLHAGAMVGEKVLRPASVVVGKLMN